MEDKILLGNANGRARRRNLDTTSPKEDTPSNEVGVESREHLLMLSPEVINLRSFFSLICYHASKSYYPTYKLFHHYQFTMSSYLTYGVYIGYWVDWAKGPVLGATITLPSRWAVVFSAALVIFVQYTGSQSWDILRFLLHQGRLSRRMPATEFTESSITNRSPSLKPQNGLFYQQQVVLRNVSSNTQAFWEVFRLATQWHSKTSHALRSSISLMLLMLLHAAIWILAALFVSKVANTTGPEVLIRGANCGYPNYTWANNVAVRERIFHKVLSDVNDAYSYAQSCYVDSNEAVGCVMPTQQLYGAWESATCPFGDLCLAAYTIDSGMIDSDLNLGINAPPSNRILYERVSTCAAINTTGFSAFVNATENSSYPTGDLVQQFYFGPNSDFSEENVTYEYDTHMNGSFSTYQLYWATTSSWTPIPELNQSDADITIMFISANDVHYPAPVDDPIFSAHRQHVSSDNETYYLSDNPVTVLACTEKQQFCLPADTEMQGNQACTGLYSWSTTQDNLVSLWNNSQMNAAQYLTAWRISQVTSYAGLYWILGGNSGSLAASSTVLGTFQTVDLPSNQTQVEVSRWLAVSYAYLQETIVQYAIGQSNYDPSQLILPTDPYEFAMCKAQKLRNFSGYTNFSFLGVTLTLVVGATIIITGYSLQPVVSFLWSHRRHRDDRQRGEYCTKAWGLDNKFQLLRKAFQGEGHGDWEQGDRTIPRTHLEELLKYFTITAEGNAHRRRESHKSEDTTAKEGTCHKEEGTFQLPRYGQ